MESRIRTSCHPAVHAIAVIQPLTDCMPDPRDLTFSFRRLFSVVGFLRLLRQSSLCSRVWSTQRADVSIFKNPQLFFPLSRSAQSQQRVTRRPISRNSPIDLDLMAPYEGLRPGIHALATSCSSFVVDQARLDIELRTEGLQRVVALALTKLLFRSTESS